MTARAFQLTVVAPPPPRTATVTWTAPTANSAGQSFDGTSNDRKIAKYRIYYAVDPTAPYSEPASIAAKTAAYVEVNGVASPYSPPATTYTFNATQLTSAGTWYFRVTAFDYAVDNVSPGDESDVSSPGSKVIA